MERSVGRVIDKYQYDTSTTKIRLPLNKHPPNRAIKIKSEIGNKKYIYEVGQITRWLNPNNSITCAIGTITIYRWLRWMITNHKNMRIIHRGTREALFERHPGDKRFVRISCNCSFCLKNKPLYRLVSLQRTLFICSTCYRKEIKHSE